MAGRIFFYMPTIFIIYFYLFCAYATLHLGFLPRYANPDPKNAFGEPILLTVYLVFLLALGAVMWSGVRVLRFNLLKNLLHLAQVVFVVMLFYFDPGGLFEWFLD